MPDDTAVGDAAHNEELWEQHAAWWQHTFTGGADPEYEDQILPLVARHLDGARRVLDIGCGEGQVARHVAGTGAEVLGLDPAPSQVREARRRGGGPRYAQARAEALPWRNGSFDAVVACLAFEHVDAIDVAIHEVAARPSTRWPVPAARRTPAAAGAAQRLGRGPDHRRALLAHRCLPPRARRGRRGRAGVRLRFIHRPLSRYVHALGRAGLLVDDMEEPPPPAALLETLWRFPEAATIPRIVLIRARRRP